MAKYKTKKVTAMTNAKAEAVAAKVEENLDHIRNIPAGGIAISPEDQKVLEGSIDDRMAALLKDHQDMGVRPK